MRGPTGGEAPGGSLHSSDTSLLPPVKVGFAVRPNGTPRFALSSALLVVLALVLVACTGGATAGVAARVGDTEITVAEVDDVFARRAEGSGVASEIAADESGQVEQSLRAGVLTNLIRVEVLRQAAQDRDIEVTDEEIAQQREQLIEDAGGEDALQQVIDQANVSDAELEANLRDQVIQNEITAQLAEDVTDEDVRAAFDDDPQGRYGEKVEVRHILTEKRAEARSAIERIESGEDFGEVASEVSIDTVSAQNGGDLGAIGKGATVPEFEEAAFAADEGEIVGPIKSDFGFHVIEVTGQVPAEDFTDVQSQIRTELESASGGQAFNEYITEFVASLDIEVDEQFGRWDDATVSVVPADDGAASEAPVVPTAPPVPTEVPTELPS